MIPEVKHKTEDRMNAVMTSLKHEFSTIRTGRASLSLVDDVMVDYYGTPSPLNQVATLSLPDGRTIAIAPWESKMIGPIEKALQKSDLGINPINDGKLIRLIMQPLTEERRKELVKKAKKMSEDAKVAIRNARRDSNETLKKAEKDKAITEDDLMKGEQEVQKMTDEFIKRVDDALVHKEKEIMEV
ncbi:MAG: ribosome recycling factor [Nitrospirae bacterium]|nr:ribosome recycling factor [Nitrospirota bacterium]